MRKQVIDIFSEWMNYCLHHQEECADNSNACRQWVETNYPEASEEVVSAVVKSYERTPDAVCSWEFTKDSILNIIVKNENKQPLNINNNE